MFLQPVFLQPAKAQSITWSTLIDSTGAFSSPATADLNQDGVKDLIIGAGIEGAASPRACIALNGRDGSFLWTWPGRNQLFTSPQLQDLNRDSVPDIIIGGRSAQLYALNGRNGQLIWEFWPSSQARPDTAGWYNFYTPQWVPDQDSDGLKDLIVTNGGDADARAWDTIRPPGHLLLLSSKDGSILAQDTMPDGRETYNSPLVDTSNGTTKILFGSGGETIRGHYYQVDLPDFIQNGLQNARPLLRDSLKGFIAVPSLADLDQDAILDYLIPAQNGRLIALDGNTQNPLWEISIPGTENYVSPVIGQFTGDNTPDAFAIFAEGKWPFYSRYRLLLIDGSNGNIVWQDTNATYQLASGNALDYDNDGYDELLLIRNTDIGFSQVNFQNQFTWLDFNNQTQTPFSGPRNGLNVFTSPLITDLDNDQQLDLIFTHHPQTANWYNYQGFYLSRIQLPLSTRPLAWAGYLGNRRNGIYYGNTQVGIKNPQQHTDPWTTIKVWPQPVTETLHLEAPPALRIVLYTLTGQQILSQHSEQKTIDFSAVPPGSYLLTCIQKDGSVIWQKRIIKLP